MFTYLNEITHKNFIFPMSCKVGDSYRPSPSWQHLGWRSISKGLPSTCPNCTSTRDTAPSTSVLVWDLVWDFCSKMSKNQLKSEIW
jgi:hypothetical protein